MTWGFLDQGQNTPVRDAAYSRGYVVLFFRMIDIALQTLIWRDYDITISAQCGLAMRRLRPPLWARVLNAVLNALEPNHCELAIAADRERARSALELLGPPPGATLR